MFLWFYIKSTKNSIDLGRSHKWLEFVVDLKDESAKGVSKECEEFFKSFEEILIAEIGDNNNLLAEIIDFFIEKYIKLQNDDAQTLILTEELEDFIYWFAAGHEACTVELAIYNPFAGTCSFGKRHACGLNFQLKDELQRHNLESLLDLEESKKMYKESAIYEGVESNVVYRAMGLVRLLVNNPLNLEQMFINSGNSLNVSLDGYSGGWTMITVPPIKSVAKPTIFDIGLVDNIVAQFIAAEGFYDAFLVLPKSFCYDEDYDSIRRQVVCKGILGAVIELPQEAFKSTSDHVLMYLRKSSVLCGTKFVDGRYFVKDGKLDWNIIYVCQDYDDEPSEYCKKTGDYTIAQSGYCLIPSLYVNPYKFVADNDSLQKFHTKYLSLIETEIESEKKRVAHRDVSGQLSHMLGTTYHKIFNAISELKYVEGLESTYSMLNDNFEYMRRLINSIDDDFSSQNMSLEEVHVNEFLRKYCKAWKNYGKKQFAVDLESLVGDDSTFRIDDVFMKVMLDAILENANRHGFNGEDIENPQILISASYTSVNNIPCVLITIANNGAPFPNDLTIEKYIREGEFGGKNGHTGRGGYHVYQIAKRHHGYISIGSDDKWNVKINIIIPIEYYNECETDKISEYGEEYM